MQLEFITINNFSLIPVTRYIINDVSKNYEANITEIFINNQYTYSNVKKVNYIGKFDSYAAFSNQSIVFKIWKHFYVYLKLFKIFLLKNAIVYTPDFEVLVIAIKLKKLFKSKSKLIYHQFELLEVELLPKNKQHLWKHVLENTAQIDLIIFPEINRLNFFIENTKFPTQKTLLFANTCKVVEENDKIINQELENKLNKISEHSIIIGHIGSLGSAHYYKEFINIIECSAEYNFHFLIIGNYDSTVSQAFKLIKNPKVTILNLLPHKDLLAVYQYIDIGLILYKGVDLNFEYCAPNKLYEYWSNGIQVIANNLKGLTPLFNEEYMGKLFDLNNPRSIKLIVDYIKSAEFSRDRIKVKFKDAYSIETQLENLQFKLAK